MSSPIKLSDFFGKLSISHSPFSWIVWFSYVSALLVNGGSLPDVLSAVYYFVVFVILCYCCLRSYNDRENVDLNEFRSERRFIAGSGLSALLIGSATVFSTTSSSNAIILTSIPCVIMGIVFMKIAVNIPERSGYIHNFTQTYMGTMASFTGFTTFFVQSESCSQVDCTYSINEIFWTGLFLFFWVVFFLIFLVNLFFLRNDATQKVTT